MSDAQKNDNQEKKFTQDLKLLSSSARARPASRQAERSSVTDGSSPLLGISVYRGYIKIWRKIQFTSFYKDSICLHLFLHLLLECQHRDQKYSLIFNQEQIYLGKGQCVIGRNKLAQSLGMPPSTVRDGLARLSEKHRVITQKSDSRATIVTILNWDTYQNEEFESRQLDDSRTTAGRQPDDTKQECNNVIKKEINNNKDKGDCKGKEKAKPLTAQDFLESLKANPAYEGIDLRREFGKMDAWLAAHPGRKKTRRFVVNWLNKAERPLAVEANPMNYNQTQMANVEAFSDFLRRKGAARPEDLHEGNGSNILDISVS